MTEPAHQGDFYKGTDLAARRGALGLLREDLPRLLELDPAKYRAREEGTRPVSASLLEPLVQMQELVDQITATALNRAHTAPSAPLTALTDPEAFLRAYPHARTRTGRPWPVTLHQLAIGRAAAALTRQGQNTAIELDDGRHGDLLCRRIATGLYKAECGHLLGFTKEKWAVWERGERRAPEPVVAELQAIDDFITDVAGALDVHDGAITVDRHRFHAQHPGAHTIRDRTPYPPRLERVAAARRAAELTEASAAPISIRDRATDR